MFMKKSRDRYFKIRKASEKAKKEVKDISNSFRTGQFVTI